jgi:hypothetical protein
MKVKKGTSRNGWRMKKCLLKPIKEHIQRQIQNGIYNISRKCKTSLWRQKQLRIRQNTNVQINGGKRGGQHVVPGKREMGNKYVPLNKLSMSEGYEQHKYTLSGGRPTGGGPTGRPRGRPPMTCSSINQKTFGRKKKETIDRAQKKKCETRVGHLHKPCEVSPVTNRCVAKIGNNFKVYKNDAFSPKTSNNSWKTRFNPTFDSSTKTTSNIVTHALLLKDIKSELLRSVKKIEGKHETNLKTQKKPKKLTKPTKTTKKQ